MSQCNTLPAETKVECGRAMRLEASVTSSSAASLVPAKVPKHCRAGMLLRGSWLPEELVNSELLLHPKCSRVKSNRRLPVSLLLALSVTSFE